MLNVAIHPTAAIGANVQLGKGVTIGPFAIVEEGAVIGEQAQIGPMTHIYGNTVLGPRTAVHTGACLGSPAGKDGAANRLHIGADTVIRERVVILGGLDEEATQIGDGCFIMGLTRIDACCKLGQRVVIANGTVLARRVEVGNAAFISGNVIVEHSCHIGRLAMIGMLAHIERDAPPFMLVEGNPGRIRAINAIGLKRAHVSTAVVLELKRLLRQINTSSDVILLPQTLEPERFAGYSPESHELLEFLRRSLEDSPDRLSSECDPVDPLPFPADRSSALS